MEEQVLQTIRTQDLVRATDHVLVAVSGGADSVAMLRALVALRPTLSISLTVAHVNHQLRAAASDDDEQFVRSLANELGLPVRVHSEDVAAAAAAQGWSTEMAGRQVRYRFLAAAATDCGATLAATGHTWNDQAETVLMRLCQGSGSRGLRGIPYRAQQGALSVIRPLRDVRRSDVLQYLSALKQPYREDASNQDPVHLRNRFRHDVMPVLESVLPLAGEALVRSAEIAEAEYDWQQEQARAWLADLPDVAPVTVVALVRLPVALQRNVLRCWIETRTDSLPSVGYDAIERIRALAGSTDGSRSVPLSRGWQVVREYNELQLIQDPPAEAPAVPETRLRVPGVVRIERSPLSVEIQPMRGRIVDSEERVGHYPAMASIRRVEGEVPNLWVRRWRPGDRIWPTGMTGSRKLQDVFVDLKVPVSIRHQIPVVATETDVVWLPGYRVDRRWALQTDQDPCYRIEITRDQTDL